jgi:two-component system, LytTR family, response regulator LytT
MNILLLEDEKPAAAMLRSYVLDCKPDSHILDILESVRQAEEWFRINDMPDLIIADIQLLDENIFFLLRKVTFSCPVIFVTAYNDYFKQAFDSNGIAYLLKPVTREDVGSAIKKYEVLKNGFNFQLLRNFSVINPAVRYKQRFAVKSSGGFFLLEINTIEFIQVKDGLTWAYTAGNKKHLLSETITRLEELLDPHTFLKINRAEIININFVKKFIPNGKDCVSIKMSSDAILVSSAGKTAALRKWLAR